MPYRAQYRLQPVLNGRLTGSPACLSAFICTLLCIFVVPLRIKDKGLLPGATSFFSLFCVFTCTSWFGTHETSVRHRLVRTPNCSAVFNAGRSQTILVHMVGVANNLPPPMIWFSLGSPYCHLVAKKSWYNGICLDPVTNDE